MICATRVVFTSGASRTACSRLASCRAAPVISTFSWFPPEEDALEPCVPPAAASCGRCAARPAPMAAVWLLASNPPILLDTGTLLGPSLPAVAAGTGRTLGLRAKSRHREIRCVMQPRAMAAWRSGLDGQHPTDGPLTVRTITAVGERL